MAKVAALQTNFNAGELSPLLYGRPDIDKYGNALAMCLNAIPLVQGAWSRRPGFIFAAEVKDSTKDTRVVRFEYSVTQAYIIEFGDLYCRFYKDGAAILEATKTITGATAANPVVITSGSHGYSNGDDVVLASIGGMTELNGRRVRAKNVAANTFEITDLQGNNIDGTAFTAYTSGGTAARVYTLTTTYAEDDLFQLKFTQSADVMWITHKDYQPRKLTRTAHTAWTLTTESFQHGPFLSQNTTATTLTPSAVTGAGITITASAVTGINNDLGFQTPGDVGRLIRINNSGATWGWAVITAVGSTTSVTATVISDFPATAASVNWRIGVWSDYAGWPTCATFYEGRLAYAGGAAKVNLVSLSRTGRYADFKPTDADGTVVDDHAVNVELSSNDVQAIRWMLADEKGLLCGTINGEFIVRSSTTGEALTPTNRKSAQATDHGSADVQAIRCSKAAIMLDHTGRSIHELTYVYTDDGFRAPEMTVLAEHITKGGLVELAYQKHPQPVVWAPRADGTLVGMTYNREQSVVGWHRHELGGVSDIGETIAANVESVACIPAADGSYNELWVVVRRRINGVWKRYIEYSAEPYDRGELQGTAVYVDAAYYEYRSAAGTSVSGLWHLVGETVEGQYDGKVMPPQVVPASGEIELPDSALRVAIGLPYKSDGQTLRNNAGAADGTAQGKTQRIHRLTLRLHETGALMVGKSFDAIDALEADGQAAGAEELIFRTSEDMAGAATPLYSGDYSRPFEGDYTTDNVICWRASGPLPATILAIMPQQVTQDR